MWSETLDLDQLAGLLGRDSRELSKLAMRGQLPGRKVGGQWRFATAEIHHWLERHVDVLTENELNALDPRCPVAGREPLISTLLPRDCIDLNLPARTAPSVVRELVKLADRSHQIWDVDAIRESVSAREQTASTARREGFAIPHPHRRVANTLGDSVVAFARVPSGIAFGGESGIMTDLFFLVCCVDDRTHIKTLARLARLLRLPGLLDELRTAETPAAVLGLIEAEERGLTN